MCHTFENSWPASRKYSESLISLHARVIKVNFKINIMGKNWIALQDGTGAASNNKLIAPSSEMVTTCEIVTAKGVIRNDVDLDYGYHYEALQEDATFVKQELLR